MLRKFCGDSSFHVYMFRPVKDVPLYYNSFVEKMAFNGLLLFPKVVELSVYHRQSSNIRFPRILNRVAVGDITYEDFQTSSQRNTYLFY